MINLSLRLGVITAVLGLLGVIAAPKTRRGGESLFYLTDGFLALGISLVLAWGLGGLFPGLDWTSASAPVRVAQALVFGEVLKASWFPAGFLPTTGIDGPISLTLGGWLVGAFGVAGGTRFLRRHLHRTSLSGCYMSSEEHRVAGIVTGWRQGEDGQEEYEITVEYESGKEGWNESRGGSIWAGEIQLRKWKSRQEFIHSTKPNPLITNGGPVLGDLTVILTDPKILGGQLRKVLIPSTTSEGGFLGSIEVPPFSVKSRMTVVADLKWPDRRLEDVLTLVADWSLPGEIEIKGQAPNVLLGNRSQMAVPATTSSDDIEAYLERVRALDPEQGVLEVVDREGLSIHLVNTGLDSFAVGVAVTTAGLRWLTNNLEYPE